MADIIVDRARSVPVGNLADNRIATEKKIMRFTGAHHKFRRMKASWVLDLASANKLQNCSELRARIVLLGGTYSQASVNHHTPIGVISDIDLLAHTVTSEQQDDFIQPLNAFVALGLDVFTSLLLLWFFYPLRDSFGLILSTVSAVFIALLVSKLLFNYTGYFVGTFGSLANVPVALFAANFLNGITDTWHAWQKTGKRQENKNGRQITQSPPDASMAAHS